MNFEIVNNNVFKIDFDFHKRIFSVLKKTNGLLKFTNVLTGFVFIDNVDPEIILINNEPMESLRDLQEIIFNQKCFCENGGGDEFKIFDRTFDRTFE